MNTSTRRRRQSTLPCNEHPLICTALFAFMLPPAVGSLIGAGMLLKGVIPHPGLLSILVAAPLMILLFVLGMLLGAIIWLAVLKYFVDRGTLAKFFLSGPAVPFFSRLCTWIFNSICPSTAKTAGQ